MSSVLRDYLLGIAAGLSASALEKLLLRMSRLDPFLGYRVHFHELREKIREMPFLYRDLEPDLLNEFVDVDISALDSRTLDWRIDAATVVDPKERLRRSRKAVVLGQAGVGKTTFFRYVILTATRGGGNSPYFNSAERLVPFYVPLKAIDNSEPHPILRYLFRNNALLSGGGGRRRFLNLAKRAKIILLLDGYDEIQSPGGGAFDQNYILEELRLLMSGVRMTKPLRGSDEELYEALRSCRIWLSSRKEFFERFRIDLAAVSASPPTTPLPSALVELRGIARNRAALVGRIFDRYKKASAVYERLLSGEYFIQRIDASGQDELITLSANPLFLTVMCYLYVKKTLDTDTYETGLTSDTSELILQCINLLLRDIDEFKARRLSGAERAAFLNRRSAFVDEKRVFLSAFAGGILLKRVGAFDEEYLLHDAREFFRANQQYASSAEILRGLDNKSRGVPHLVDQLIFSGLFVGVDRNAARTLYDFPHRRFREVLAAKYFDDPVRLRLLSERVAEGEMAEFWPVFFGSTRHRDETLKMLLEGVTQTPNDDTIGTVVLNCLRRRSDAYDPSAAIEEFLANAISQNVAFLLPREVLDVVTLSERFLTLAMRSVSFAPGSAAKSYALEASCSVLARSNPLALREVLSREASSIDWERPHPVFVKHACLVDVQLIVGKLGHCTYGSEGFSEMVYVLARSILAGSEPHKCLRALLPSLDESAVIGVLYVLNDLDRPTVGQFIKREEIDERYEVFTSAIRSLRSAEGLSLPSAKDQTRDQYYVVTGEGIGRVKGSTVGNRLVKQRGELERLQELRGRVLIRRLDGLGSKSGLSEAIERQVVESCAVTVDLLRWVKTVVEGIDYRDVRYPEVFV